jgi:acyl carrier protein
MTIDSDTFLRIRDVLAALSAVPPCDIHPECHLLLDLGLTSLKFVDLTIGLERSFGFAEFPLQDWLDEEQQRDAEGFRLSSLMAICEHLRSGTAYR